LKPPLRLDTIVVEPPSLDVVVRSAREVSNVELLTKPVDLSQVTDETTVMRVPVSLPEGIALGKGEPDIVKVTIVARKAAPRVR
jgi:YbbR domain-containing protein